MLASAAYAENVDSDVFSDGLVHVFLLVEQAQSASRRASISSPDPFRAKGGLNFVALARTGLPVSWTALSYLLRHGLPAFLTAYFTRNRSTARAK